MAARRSTKKPVSADIDLIEEEPKNDAPDAKAPSRKYFSHANCDHARKGEAGKAARATCRRNHRAWFAAEAEYLASVNDDSVAV